MIDFRDGPIALISDVHGNVSALESVLKHMRQDGIKHIINLGDVVGYGPEPEKCIDIAMAECSCNLCGNHEYAIMNTADGFNPVASGAVDFARKRLTPTGKNDTEEAHRRWDYMHRLESVFEGPNFLAMHGSPRHSVMEYVLPSDPEVDPLKLDDIFDCMTRQVAFVGHTHFPGVIEENAELFMTTQDLDDYYEVSVGRKAIINVGSVGQPRDRDIRSCYVKFDGKRVWFQRVEYDVEKTVEKIHNSGGLHDSLGYRLLEGR